MLSPSQSMRKFGAIIIPVRWSNNIGLFLRNMHNPHEHQIYRKEIIVVSIPVYWLDCQNNGKQNNSSVSSIIASNASPKHDMKISAHNHSDKCTGLRYDAIKGVSFLSHLFLPDVIFLWCIHFMCAHIAIQKHLI